MQYSRPSKSHFPIANNITPIPVLSLFIRQKLEWKAEKIEFLLSPQYQSLLPKSYTSLSFVSIWFSRTCNLQKKKRKKEIIPQSFNSSSPSRLLTSRFFPSFLLSFLPSFLSFFFPPITRNIVVFALSKSLNNNEDRSRFYRGCDACVIKFSSRVVGVGEGVVVRPKNGIIPRKRWSDIVELISVARVSERERERERMRRSTWVRKGYGMGHVMRLVHAKISCYTPPLYAFLRASTPLPRCPCWPLKEIPRFIQGVQISNRIEVSTLQPTNSELIFAVSSN